MSAGLLAFLMEFIATDCGTVSRAIIIGLAVFVVGKSIIGLRRFSYLYSVTYCSYKFFEYNRGDSYVYQISALFKEQL